MAAKIAYAGTPGKVHNTAPDASDQGWCCGLDDAGAAGTDRDSGAEDDVQQLALLQPQQA